MPGLIILASLVTAALAVVVGIAQREGRSVLNRLLSEGGMP